MRRAVRAVAPILVGPVLVVPLALLAACAPEKAADRANGTPTAGASGLTEVLSCAIADLNLVVPGKLTIATDSPADEPYFSGDDPTNGKGFESAVAYALAEQIGFAKADVMWVKVPVDDSYQPGPKKFDFDINQISITPEREAFVDFSTSYYSAAQAAIAVAGTPGAAATSLADLKNLRLGAQTGTTSLTAIRDVIRPDTDALVFRDTNAAKQAIENNQVDVILADLPTAFSITKVEIPQATVVGQFRPETGAQVEWGLLFEKGNPLKECVDFYLESMKEAGVLANLEKDWLPDAAVPELR
ncbi:MAG: transporter substrate-binding domain-containing protein [Nocardioides sp.]